MKTMEEEGVGMCSLTCNTLGVKTHVRAPRYGLERMTSGSTIHTGLHKPNNKFISA
jgi:hypothetical protein